MSELRNDEIYWRMNELRKDWRRMNEWKKDLKNERKEK